MRQAHTGPRALGTETMGFLQQLAGRVEEVAAAGGKFADAFVRTAGATVSGALVFVDREIGFAAQAAKKRNATKSESRKRPAEK